MYGKTGDPYLELRFPRDLEVDFIFTGLDFTKERLDIDGALNAIMLNKNKEVRISKHHLAPSEVESLRLLTEMFYVEEEEDYMTFIPKADQPKLTPVEKIPHKLPDNHTRLIEESEDVTALGF